MKNLVVILFVFIAMTAVALQELQKNLFKMNEVVLKDGQAIVPTHGMATGVYFVLTQLNDKVVCTKVILR